MMGKNNKRVVKVYLAAPWNRRKEARKLASRLSKAGVFIHSDWLYWQGSSHQATAIGDRTCLGECDVVVRLLDDLSSPTVPSALATGSRMWEQGYASAKGKPIIVYGQKKQCLYDWLPGVVHVKTYKKLKERLLKISNRKVGQQQWL